MHSYRGSEALLSTHQRSLQWPGMLHIIKGNETQTQPENSLLKAKVVYLCVQFSWDQNEGSVSVSQHWLLGLKKKKKSIWNSDHSVCQNKITLKATIHVRMLWGKKVSEMCCESVQWYQLTLKVWQASCRSYILLQVFTSNMDIKTTNCVMIPWWLDSRYQWWLWYHMTQTLTS